MNMWPCDFCCFIKDNPCKTQGEYNNCPSGGKFKYDPPTPQQEEPVQSQVEYEFCSICKGDGCPICQYWGKIPKQ